MNDRETFIDSSASVAKILKEEHHIEAKPQEVMKIMRGELDMRYRRVKEMSWHSNSEKNLVLRQQFALKLLSILQGRFTILNLDETWLSMSDFRKMKWRVKGTKNSVPKK